MTHHQQQAVNCAHASAKVTVAGFEKTCGATFPDHIRKLLTGAIVAAQLGMAREVAQYSANERAELARLGGEEVLEAIQSLKL